MISARDLIHKLSLVLSEKTDAAREIDATYKFELQGEGGGCWVVNLKDDVGVFESNEAADCTIALAASDFIDLFEGRANGQQLFFAGKLRIEGDLQLAMKLQKLTELMR